VPRESVFTRLVHHFHEHPQGRLHEILFWAGLGVVVGAGAYIGWRTGAVNDGIALILAVVAVCLVGFALLPQRKVKPRPIPPGKRGAIAQQVRASKAEKKNKGGVPPGPPIRRG